MRVKSSQLFHLFHDRRHLQLFHPPYLVGAACVATVLALILLAETHGWNCLLSWAVDELAKRALDIVLVLVLLAVDHVGLQHVGLVAFLLVQEELRHRIAAHAWLTVPEHRRLHHELAF